MNSTFKNFLSLFSSEITSKIFFFLSTVYLTRILLDNGYGLLSFVQACISYVSIIADMGLCIYGTRQIARFRILTNSSEQIRDFYPKILYTKLTLNLIISLIIFLFLNIIDLPFSIKELFFLSLIQIIIASLNPEWVLLGLEDMKTVANIRVLRAMLLLILFINLVRLPTDVPYVLVASIIIEVITILLLFAFIYKKHNLQAEFLQFIRDKTIFKQAFYLGFSYLLVTVYYSSDTIILGFFRQMNEVGWYSAAYKIPLILSPGITGILINIFLPQLTMAYHSQNQFKLIHKEFQKYAYLGAFLVLVFIPISDKFFLLIFGEIYSKGIPALKILLLTNAVIFISITYGNSLIAAGFERIYMIGTLIGALLNIFLNFILIYKWGVIGAASATLLSEITVLFFMYYFFTKKLFKAPFYRPPLKISLKKYFSLRIFKKTFCLLWTNSLKKFKFQYLIISLISLGFSFLLIFLFSLRFYFPDKNSTFFIWKHYIGPLTTALFIPLFVIFFINKNSAKIIFSVLKQIRIFIAFIIIVFLHFNLKLWSQLINKNLFDNIYFNIDQHLSPVISVFIHFRKIIWQFLPDWSNAYHDIFVLMFLISFALHGALNKGFDRMLTATSIVLILGGFCYSIAPACGPFIYEKGPILSTTNIQLHMLQFYTSFVKSNGTIYEGRFFVAALAAMPSLHIANALVFTYFSIRYLPFLSFLYIPFCIILIIDAVVLKWHYLIDIPFGIIIAFISVALTYWFFKYNFSAQKNKISSGENILL